MKAILLGLTLCLLALTATPSIASSVAAVGRAVWRTPIAAGTVSQPFHQKYKMDSDRYYVLDASYLLSAIDRQSGNVAWTYQTEQYNSGYFVVEEAGVIICNESPYKNVALNSSTGSLLWTVKGSKSSFSDQPYRWSESNSKVIGANLLVSSSGDSATGSGGNLTVYRAIDGSMVWQSVGWVGESHAHTCGGLVIGVATFFVGGLAAFDPKTGAVMWNTSSPSQPEIFSCMEDKYILGFSDQGGNTAGVFTMDAATGKVVGDAKDASSLDYNFFNRYYCGQIHDTSKTYVHCYELPKMTSLWREAMPCKESCGSSLFDDDLNGNQYVWFCNFQANTTVYGLSAANGTALWSQSIKGYAGTGEVHRGKYVFLPTNNGFAAVNSQGVKTYNDASGLRPTSIFVEKEAGTTYVYLATGGAVIKVPLA